MQHSQDILLKTAFVVSLEQLRKGSLEGIFPHVDKTVYIRINASSQPVSLAKLLHDLQGNVPKAIPSLKILIDRVCTSSIEERDLCSLYANEKRRDHAAFPTKKTHSCFQIH